MPKSKRRPRLPVFLDANERNLRTAYNRVRDAYDKVRIGLPNQRVRNSLFRAGVPQVVIDGMQSLDASEQQVFIRILHDVWLLQRQFYIDNFSGDRMEKVVEELHWNPHKSEARAR